MNNAFKEKTLDYYNQHANEFVENTFHAQISQSLEFFTRLLCPKAHILDVGCGSGRDSLYFINRGYSVVSFDASEEVAKIAETTISHPVLVQDIETMPWNNEFDGVWAMASLLHLPKNQLQLAITNCVKSLKVQEKSYFFASFKIGEGEHYDEKGRFFSYYQPDEIKNILNNTHYFQDIKYEINEDSLGRTGLSWISFFAEKKIGLQLEQNSYFKKTTKKF